MRSRLPLLLSVTALLLLAVVAARGRSAVPYTARRFGPILPPAPTTTPPTSQESQPNSVLDTVSGIGVGALVVLFVVALLVGIAVTIVAVTRWRPRRKLGPTVQESVADDTDGGSSDGMSTEALLRGARSALAELHARAGGPPSDAVVAAWLLLEDAAADSGTRRQPHETPTEFTAALLAAHTVDQAALAALLDLYARARFGPAGSVTDEDATGAATALDRIVADLATVAHRSTGAVVQ
ncbi:DUF4129 domain-containing protein [Solihabitans fulvus]|uniref:DUF4129 domain-containing protein n=1 Tax=Solihabitans fulvus TaxID=1892852 RepID=A0A5B2XK58_9PSEU|nr:DUF4129 domain-containing protein [Solihabitans fulvus]KAA2263270.1 DUF4129 domain-containing protein [Solihabitans fulvus]